MKGKIIRLPQKKSFGFLEPDDNKGKDVFFHFSQLASKDEKSKLAVGASVEFEYIDPEPDEGPKAIDVRVINGGNAVIQSATPKQSQPVTRPSTPAKPTLRMDPNAIALEIKFVFRESILQVLVETNIVGFDLSLRIKLGAAEWTEHGTRLTDGKGLATFLVDIDPNLQFLPVRAVMRLDAGEALWESIWFRNPPEEVTQSESAQAVKSGIAFLQATAHQSGDTLLLEVSTTKKADVESPTVATTVKFRSDNGARFHVRAVGRRWKSGSGVELLCSGHETYQAQWVERIAGGNLFLSVPDNPKKSGPHYMSGHCWSPQEPASAPQATTTVVQ